MSAQRNRLIAQIHIGKSQLGLDDDTYCALLKGVAGKTSCSALSFAQLHQVVEAMKQRGFKPKGKPSPKTRNLRIKSRVDKLRAIWITMGHCGHIADASETALLHWVQGQLKKRNADTVDALNWLDAHKDCNLILEQLKQWRDRCNRNALNDDLKMISDATAALEQLGNSFSQPEVIQVLLDHGVITWHDLFNSLGLEPQPHYTGNRQHLRPLSFILEARQCN